jgi:hypothetical protein
MKQFLDIIHTDDLISNTDSLNNILEEIPIIQVQVLTADIKYLNQRKTHLDYEIYQIKSENKLNLIRVLNSHQKFKAPHKKIEI